MQKYQLLGLAAPVILLASLFFLPAKAADSLMGRLRFQFSFMDTEMTEYRAGFLKDQLDYFDFDENTALNETLLTELFLLMDSHFGWEEEGIVFGIEDVDFTASKEEVCTVLFSSDHQRRYICKMVDDYNWNAFFYYLIEYRLEHGTRPIYFEGSEKGLPSAREIEEVISTYGAPDALSYQHFIFLGDSRFVGIRDYTGYDERCSFLCEIGMGYSWLTGEAYSALSGYDPEQTALIINLGVNDLVGNGPFDGLASQYADFINNAILPLGFDVYYMSVNPVDDTSCQAAGYPLYNDKVINFNDNLRAFLSDQVGWIDTYSWFLDNGLGFAGDGLHYPADTNQAILDKALSELS